MLLRSFLVIEDEKDTTYRTYIELFPPINSMISVHCFQCLSVSLIG